MITGDKRQERERNGRGDRCEKREKYIREADVKREGDSTGDRCEKGERQQGRQMSKGIQTAGETDVKRAVCISEETDVNSERGGWGDRC